MQWTADGDGFFVSRCKAAGGGKKLATDVAGRRARRSRSSVRPNSFEDAVGVAVREIRGTRQWRRSASTPDIKTVVNLRSHQSSPDLRRQGPTIVHGHTGAPPDPHLRRSTDVGMPETITRRSNVTVLVNGRSRIPRAQPGREVSMPRTERPLSRSCRWHCGQSLPCPRAPERGFIIEGPPTAALRVSD